MGGMRPLGCAPLRGRKNMNVKQSAALALSIGLVTACGGTDHEVEFTGYVYDIRSGERLTGDAYSIALWVGADEKEASIQEDGRYVLPAISAFEDYSIVIEASGYRSFRSHNGREDLPASVLEDGDYLRYNTDVVAHYDAYLVPADLRSGEVTFQMRLNDAPDERAISGEIRLIPLGPSVLADEDSEQYPSVGGQVWTNDEDIQAAGRVLGRFSEGRFVIEEGTLLYGVQYKRDIFNVPGYQPYTDTFDLFSGGFTVALSPAAAPDLELFDAAPLPNGLSNDGTLRIRLSEPVVWADSPSGYEPSEYPALIDERFDVIGGSFTDDSIKHTSVKISGDTITFSWDLVQALAAADDEIVALWNVRHLAVAPAQRPRDARLLWTILTEAFPNLEFDGTTGVYPIRVRVR